MDEWLYDNLIAACKRLPALQREQLKSEFNYSGEKWSDPDTIFDAALFIGIDIRKIIISKLSKSENADGTGSSDDGVIYILSHSVHPIVKIGKTKSSSTDRAYQYAKHHDDSGQWTLHHQVKSRDVSQVEAEIHDVLKRHRAAYGFNSKEVFEVSVERAMQVLYISIRL